MSEYTLTRADALDALQMCAYDEENLVPDAGCFTVLISSPSDDALAFELAAKITDGLEYDELLESEIDVMRDVIHQLEADSVPDGSLHRVWWRNVTVIDTEPEEDDGQPSESDPSEAADGEETA